MKAFVAAAALAAGLVIDLLIAGVAAAEPMRGPVEIVVWNIRKSVGHIRVAVCTRTTFVNEHEDCPYRAEAMALRGETTVLVPDVPAGTYAAQVFQDERDEHEVRRGLLGVPLVGIGFSNDAPVSLTAPKFKDAAFDHDPPTPSTLRIRLRYFPNL